ncbi:protein phosphatase 2C domain-containing protein [Candidatus Peregrinibacteria bacterium]|nr:protein phosphatase 2C domain-containing protein [Candidatus Peregrinibacteria bacterium]
MANTNHAHSLPEPQESKKLFTEQEVDELLDLEKHGIVVNDSEEILLTEEDLNIIKAQEKVRGKVNEKVVPPHVTDGIPDNEFKKKLHESKIIKGEILAYSGNEEGKAEGLMGDMPFYAVTENGIYYANTPKERNDDGFLIDPKSKTLIVTDGIGSVKVGYVASNIALHRAAVDLDKTNLKSVPPYKLDTLVQNMNHSVDEYQDNNPSFKKTSATVVAARINDDRSVDIAYAGDSKAIIIRGDKVVFTTIEDNALSYIMWKDKITEQEAQDKFGYEQYWKLKNGVLQCLGHEANYVSWETKETSRDVNPHLQNIKTQKGDVLILCSDGLSDNLTDSEIAWSINKSLKNEKSLNEAIEHLKLEALHKMKNPDEGKGDNITIAGVQIQ